MTETPERRPALRTAALFLLLGLLWFLTAELVAARLLGPEGREAADAVARWGFPVLGALLVYRLGRRTGRRLEEVGGRLDETRALLRRSVRSVRDALFVIDVAERAIVWCNPAAEEMFGYDRDTMVGASTRLLHVDEEHWRGFAERSDHAVAQGETWRGSFVMRRADGETIHTEHTVSLLEETGGERVLAVSAVRDVTDRVEPQERLRRRMRRHRAILAHVSDLITVLDEEANILYANPTARDLFGWEPDELIGRTGFDLVHPDDRERLEDAFRRTFREGEGRARYRLRRGDGSWSLVESRGVVPDAEALPGIVVVTRVLEPGGAG